MKSAMLKSDTYEYYYSDAKFQLEVNLHKVRKELVSLLEFYEKTDCDKCLLLKCKCVKTDIKSNCETVSNNSGNKTTNNNEPCEYEVKEHIDAAEASKKKVDIDDQSPTPSTPEKITSAQDIEAWMDASNVVKAFAEKMVLNSKNSLVTIESVRPADLPLKTLQKSCILNTANVLNRVSLLNSANMNSMSVFNSSSITHARTLEAFFKCCQPQLGEARVVSTTSKLSAVYDKQTIWSDYYFKYNF